MSKENENIQKEIKYDERGREQVKAWYALVVLPGHEIKIREKLSRLAENEHLKDQIFRIMVPTIKEEKTDAKGKTKIKENLVYTQYVYVEMILNDNTYHAVKIGGVRHILGVPTPVPEEDIRSIYELMGEEYEPTNNETKLIKVGDEVEITESPMEVFKNKKGIVVEIEEEDVNLEVEIDGNVVSYQAQLKDLKK